MNLHKILFRPVMSPLSKLSLEKMVSIIMLILQELAF